MQVQPEPSPLHQRGWQHLTSQVETARSCDTRASPSTLPWVLPAMRARHWRETQARRTSKGQGFQSHHPDEHSQSQTLLHTARRMAAPYSRWLQLQVCAYLTFRCPRGGRGRALQPPCPLLEGSKGQQIPSSAKSFPSHELNCAGAVKHSEKPGPATLLQEAMRPISGAAGLKVTKSSPAF